MNGPRISWRKNGERRLRVLAADDHALTLANVSTLLAESFDLVAAVTDGLQAVDAASRLDPDVVVLDVTMPNLNGFQTARELTRTGSRAKIVMLTMHQSDDFVAAAVTSGAGAYVLKSRMASDLEAAIDHVIAGRLFVPSLTSLLAIAPAPGAGGQAAQLGVTDRTGLTELSAVLTAALRRGDVAGIVASEATRTGIAERLVANGCDLDEAADRGKYISLDAGDALSAVYARRAARRRPHGGVRRRSRALTSRRISGVGDDCRRARTPAVPGRERRGRDSARTRVARPHAKASLSHAVPLSHGLLQ